jgi:hypothetical protein
MRVWHTDSSAADVAPRRILSPLAEAIRAGIPELALQAKPCKDRSHLVGRRTPRLLHHHDVLRGHAGERRRHADRGSVGLERKHALRAEHRIRVENGAHCTSTAFRRANANQRSASSPPECSAHSRARTESSNGCRRAPRTSVARGREGMRALSAQGAPGLRRNAGAPGLRLGLQEALAKAFPPAFRERRQLADAPQEMVVWRL